MALVYLFERFFYRIFEFLRHWYQGGFFFFSQRLINVLEQLDRYLALRITLRYLFKPLYQNYTFIGYLLGFIFRSLRLVAASVVYFLVFLVALGAYLLWAVIPIFILAKIIK